MYLRTDQFYRSNIIGICIQPIGLNNVNALLAIIDKYGVLISE